MLQRSRGLALVREHLLNQSVSVVDLGVGSFLTISFHGTTVKFWIYLAAWNVSKGQAMLVACEDERDVIALRVQQLVGRTVNETRLDACNNMRLGMDDELSLNILGTNTDDSPWLLFDEGNWFLGANTDGTFSFEREGGAS